MLFLIIYLFFPDMRFLYIYIYIYIYMFFCVFCLYFIILFKKSKQEHTLFFLLLFFNIPGTPAHTAFWSPALRELVYFAEIVIALKWYGSDAPAWVLA